MFISLVPSQSWQAKGPLKHVSAEAVDDDDEGACSSINICCHVKYSSLLMKSNNFSSLMAMILRNTLQHLTNSDITVWNIGFNYKNMVVLLNSHNSFAVVLNSILLENALLTTKNDIF